MALLIGSIVGRGSGGVTADRLDVAVAAAFANLIEVQRPLLGLTPIDPAALAAQALCHKIDPASEPRGGGAWSCVITWTLPGRWVSRHDTYEVAVTMDGCYTATSEGAEGHLGGPTLVTQDGSTVRNLLYVFDGCFDVSPRPAGPR